MKKLLPFALLLMLVACEKNEPNIVTPTFENRITTRSDVIETIGTPDVIIELDGNAKYIYFCEFTEVFGRYIRIESKERFFTVLFCGDVVISSHYSYSNNNCICSLIKNNPPK